VAIPVIVPFYKNQRQLDACLAALGRQGDLARPWVWDNSQENLYYTKAVNLGLRAALDAGEEFAIVCTQDVYLQDGAVAAMVDFLRAMPRCAIAGIKQLLASNPDTIIHAGGTIAFPDGYHLQGDKSKGECTQSRRVPWVNGACLAARLQAVREFGLMDEGMLMLGSDSDWCYSARAKGWDVWYCAQAECLHETGVSIQGASDELAAIFLRDMDHWRKKWLATDLYEQLESEFPETNANARLGAIFKLLSSKTGQAHGLYLAGVAAVLAQKNVESVGHLALAASLGELAVARWKNGGHANALPLLLRAKEELLACRDDKPAWRSTMTALSMVCGYFAVSATTGKPPAAPDGRPAAPPRTGIFLSVSPRFAEQYGPQTEVNLGRNLAALAQAIGQTSKAAPPRTLRK
jgi:hypothetical protein